MGVAEHPRITGLHWSVSSTATLPWQHARVMQRKPLLPLDRRWVRGYTRIVQLSGPRALGSAPVFSTGSLPACRIIPAGLKVTLLPGSQRIMSEHAEDLAAEKRRFVSDAWTMGLAQVGGSLATWVLLPVLTQNLGPEKYGLWVLTLVLVSYVLPWCELGLSASLVRFVPGYPGDLERRQALTTARRLNGGISLCFGLSLAVGADWVAQRFLGSAEHGNVIRLLGVLIFLEGQFFLSNTFLQAREKIGFYALLNALRSLGDLALLATLVLWTESLEYLVLAKIGVLAVLVLCQWYHLRSLGRGIRKSSFSTAAELRRFMRHGFPLVPTNVVWLLIMMVDRNMLEHFRSTSAVGIYNVADSIALLLMNLAKPINSVILPKFSILLSQDSDEIARYLGKGIKFICLLLLPAVVGIILTGDILISLLTTPDFAEAIGPLPFLCLGYFLFSLFYPVYHLVLLQRGGRIVLYLSLISLVINVVLNLLLIPSHGETGAGLATCCCFLFYVTGLALYCRIGFGSSFRRVAGDLGKIAAAAGGMGLAVMGFRAVFPGTGLPAILAGVGSYPLLIILSGAVTPAERDLLLGPLRRILQLDRTSAGKQ